MSPVTLSLFAFEPGTTDVPAGSGTGVFVNGLLNSLREVEASAPDELEVQVRWLRPASRAEGGLGELGTAAGWMTRELGRMLRDGSRYLLFIYPKLPVLAHVTEPGILRLAAGGFRALRLKSRLTRQRIIVLVEDLPVELVAGRSRAGGAEVPLPVEHIRRIERTMFRAAHRLVVPVGFKRLIARRHALAEDVFRTFRKNVYLPLAEAGDGGADAGLPFEAAKVNFFYSGGIDASTAANFREVLRAIRNTPDCRLHMCGPGSDAVRKWFAELEVTNARHYGQLNVSAHDSLAGLCDIGLILYPADNPYNQLTPTMKYSAYLANGLAILSTDLDQVAANLEIDGVGRAFPIKELSLELMRWATRPALWKTTFKLQAAKLAPSIRSGEEMRGWIEEIASGG